MFRFGAERKIPLKSVDFTKICGNKKSYHAINITCVYAEHEAMISDYTQDILDLTCDPRLEEGPGSFSGSFLPNASSPECWSEPSLCLWHGGFTLDWRNDSGPLYSPAGLFDTEHILSQPGEEFDLYNVFVFGLLCEVALWGCRTDGCVAFSLGSDDDDDDGASGL